jgi:hypothetical protein
MEDKADANASDPVDPNHHMQPLQGENLNPGVERFLGYFLGSKREGSRRKKSFVQIVRSKFAPVVMVYAGKGREDWRGGDGGGR